MGPRFRPSCHHHAYRPLYPEKTRPFGKPRRLNLHCEVIVRLPGIIGVRSSAPPCLTELQPFPATIRAASIGGAVIGALGGLIGLGGAEFRLPLLIGLFRFGALQTVILNKTMSLVVVATRCHFERPPFPSRQSRRIGRSSSIFLPAACRCMVRCRPGDAARFANALSRPRGSAGRHCCCPDLRSSRRHIGRATHRNYASRCRRDRRLCHRHRIAASPCSVRTAASSL